MVRQWSLQRCIWPHPKGCLDFCDQSAGACTSSHEQSLRILVSRPLECTERVPKRNIGPKTTKSRASHSRNQQTHSQRLAGGSSPRKPCQSAIRQVVVADHLDNARNHFPFDAGARTPLCCGVGVLHDLPDMLFFRVSNHKKT